MPAVLPGGNMVNCVRHCCVLPRLKAGAGLAFFFPLLNEFSKPLI
ncbi:MULTISPECIES: pyrBI operon leader peptide [Klebsiella]|nr:PyrBI operon leader peptide [Klebsiella aerogenes]AUZ16904.1 PyrBI operon leader peptide [Klebsiella aerogenes]AVE39315.1 PyrBI operon leader peptide [Klebsiella aerogenes]AVE97456.1 PyrBI operon leader peptide [Klebsiella aerogenes]AWD01927.1 PyrBI operon leader peptide [Klebsiella aerogenes]